MTFSQDEIAKLDKILLFLYENEGYRIDDSFAAKKLGIDKDEYNFLCLSIVDFSDSEEKIGDIMDAGSKMRSLRLEYEAKRFIDNGGFKGYFDRQIEQMEKSTSKTEIHNGDRINIGDINHSDLQLNISSQKNSKQSKNPQTADKEQSWYTSPFVRWVIGAITALAIG